MKKAATIIKSALCVILAFALSTPTYAALSPSQEEMFAQNNILFYDPVGDNCNTTTNFTSKPSGDQITWIGDSYSTMAESKITAKFQGVDLGTTPRNIKGSKSFYYDIDGPDSSPSRLSTNGDINVSNPSGITILKNLKENNALRKYVVFALGTNDHINDASAFEGYIDQLHTITSNNHIIVLMTPRTMNVSYSQVITGINNAAKKYSNILIADWESAVKDNLSEYFNASDPIHPNDKGFELFVQTIYNALPGGSVGMLPGNNVAERIWNYLASMNIPNVSTNPAVLSGMIGNFMVESGGHTFNINPFIISSSGYYGIFQTQDTGLQDAMRAAGLDSYWGQSNAPQDALDKAIQVQMDYLINNFGHTPGFLNNLDKVTYQEGEEGAASYAELFLVTVERAVSGSEMLQDSAVQAYVNNVMYPSNPQYQNSPYQGTVARRDGAKKAYREFSGASATIVSSANSSSGAAAWSDGWLVDNSIPGMIKQDATTISLSETPKAAYTTPDSKPNKILLHDTEGLANGLAAYGGNAYPPHFTIDLKKKQGYQHFSIFKPSLALAGGDTSGPIQIEIVGFVEPSLKLNESYFLHNFTADDWDYLAVVLIAIAAETGIPLTSSLSWEKGTTRLSNEEFLSYAGIIGHLHAPLPNNHWDPDDIWAYVSAAIARNPNGAKFANGGYQPGCPANNYIGLVSGGMDKATADAFMQEYKNLEPKEWGSGGTLGTEWDIAATNCSGGDLANCVAFTQYFINRYTTAHFTGLPNGGQVVSRLLSSGQGFVSGGTTPKAYAVFSIPSGSTLCDGSPCGHTGVVLGIDIAADEIIIGEAGCSESLDWAGAHVRSLNAFSNGSYTYAYTDDILKGF